VKKIIALISSFAFITVTPNGKIISQVLGDSTLKVKSVAQNLAPANSLISLNNLGGKIELNNTDVTSLKEDLVEVESRGNVNDLKIRANGNNFSIEEQDVIANTQFPITIDPTKAELSVSTDTGMRLVSVLPFEATQVLLRGKKIDKLSSNEISLNEDNKGQLQYAITGVKNINIFNFATVKANVNSKVSATTGEILKIDEPQWLKVLEVIL
jgi:hypothetical protein